MADQTWDGANKYRMEAMMAAGLTFIDAGPPLIKDAQAKAAVFE